MRSACRAAQAAALHAEAAALHAAATARFQAAVREKPASAALATCSRASRRQWFSASVTRTRAVDVEGAGDMSPGGDDAVMASAARQEGMKRGAGILGRACTCGLSSAALPLTASRKAPLRRVLDSQPAAARVRSTALARTSSAAGPAAYWGRLVSAATVAAAVLPLSACALRLRVWGARRAVPMASGARMSTLVPGLNCCAVWRTSPGLASTTSAGSTPYRAHRPSSVSSPAPRPRTTCSRESRPPSSEKGRRTPRREAPGSAA